jgi:hypothetical protein
MTDLRHMNESFSLSPGWCLPTDSDEGQNSSISTRLQYCKPWNFRGFNSWWICLSLNLRRLKLKFSHYLSSRPEFTKIKCLWKFHWHRNSRLTKECLHFLASSVYVGNGLTGRGDFYHSTPKIGLSARFPKQLKYDCLWRLASGNSFSWIKLYLVSLTLYAFLPWEELLFQLRVLTGAVQGWMSRWLVLSCSMEMRSSLSG